MKFGSYFFFICYLYIFSANAQNSKEICTNQKNIIYQQIIFKTENVSKLLGYANQVDNIVHVIDKDGSKRLFKKGDPIFEGEKIITESNGTLQLKMTDGGVITLGQSSEIEFIKYQDSCLSECTFIAKILIGSMRYVTGLIGKINPNSVQLKTPTFAVGVRGTDHKIVVIQKNNLNILPGTYDHVYSGGTTISNAHGSLNIDAGQTGFGPMSGDLKPRLLKNNPTFLTE